MSGRWVVRRLNGNVPVQIIEKLPASFGIYCCEFTDNAQIWAAKSRGN